jgi:hypothetical protein
MYPKNMCIGTLDRDILKNKCNVEKKGTYNVYKAIWFSNCKKHNSLAKLYICKRWIA